MNLDTLLAEREINNQLVKLARAMDCRDWVTVESIFTDDVVIEMGLGEISGKENSVNFIKSFLDTCGTTQHMVGNISITVAGDIATSQAYVCDMHLAPDNNPTDFFRTLGDYHDTWAKINDTWKIKQRIKDNRGTLGDIEIMRRNKAKS